MSGGGPSGVKTSQVDVGKLMFTGTGSPEDPMGKSDPLEGNKNIAPRNESVLRKTDKGGQQEIVFRTYTPKTQAEFNKLAGNDNFTAIKTSTGHITFMQTGAVRYYLHAAKGERTRISKPVWRDGQMAVAKKADTFKKGPGLAAVEGGTKRVGGASSKIEKLEKMGFEKVPLKNGGTGFKWAGPGDLPDKAFTAIRKAGFDFRIKEDGTDIWMTQRDWKANQ